MSRIRSRVYVASIIGYSRNEQDHLEHWTRANCSDWVLLHTNTNGMPELKIYLRFSNAVSIKTIEKLNPKLNVETSIISFKQIIDSYNKLGKVESSQTKPSTKVMKSSTQTIPMLQTTIMSAADIDPGLGIVHWFNYSMTSREHSMFMRYISSRDDILITTEDIGYVKNLINEKIFKESKHITAIILMPHKTKLSPSYYELIDQLRNGFIHNNEYEKMPCVFDPLNVIVYSNAFPSESEKATFNIKLKMV